MKKIILRVLVCVIVFVAVVAGTLSYFLFKEPENVNAPVNQNTVVDVQGSTYLAVVDESGTTYAVVTDAEGNRYAAEYDGSQVGQTVAQINDQVAAEDIPQNYTGPVIDATTQQSTTAQTDTYDQTTTQQSDTQGTTGSVSSGAVPDASSQTTPSASSTNPVATDPAQTTTVQSGPAAYRIDMYQQIFKSGTYLMTILTNDADLGTEPITMALKNGNMYVETSVEGIACTMLYVRSNDTMYMLFNDWKKYCKLPEEMMGEDFDMSSMTENLGDSDIGEVSVSEVEVNGQKLVLESYISSETGETVNYYFDGDVLVRRDSVAANGSIDSMEFVEFSTNVPDSYFEIPDNFGYINLDWLGAIM